MAALFLSGCFGQGCYTGSAIVSWHQPGAEMQADSLAGVRTVRRSEPEPGLPVEIPTPFTDRFGAEAKLLWVSRDASRSGASVYFTDTTDPHTMSVGGPAADVRRTARDLLEDLGASDHDLDSWEARHAEQLAVSGPAAPGRPGIPVDLPLKVGLALEDAFGARVELLQGGVVRILDGRTTWWMSLHRTTIEDPEQGVLTVTGDDRVSLLVLENPRDEEDAARLAAERARLFGWNASVQEDPDFVPLRVCSD